VICLFLHCFFNIKKRNFSTLIYVLLTWGRFGVEEPEEKFVGLLGLGLQLGDAAIEAGARVQGHPEARLDAAPLHQRRLRLDQALSQVGQHAVPPPQIHLHNENYASNSTRFFSLFSFIILGHNMAQKKRNCY